MDCADMRKWYLQFSNFAWYETNAPISCNPSSIRYQPRSNPHFTPVTDRLYPKFADDTPMSCHPKPTIIDHVDDNSGLANGKENGRIPLLCFDAKDDDLARAGRSWGSYKLGSGCSRDRQSCIWERKMRQYYRTLDGAQWLTNPYDHLPLMIVPHPLPNSHTTYAHSDLSTSVPLP